MHFNFIQLRILILFKSIIDFVNKDLYRPVKNKGRKISSSASFKFCAVPRAHGARRHDFENMPRNEPIAVQFYSI